MSDSAKKPKDTAFRQQRLSAVIPVHTAKSSAVLFFILSMLFFIFGILLYVECNNQQEYSVRYDTLCPIYKSGPPCYVQLSIDQHMFGPVFVYYELQNFYQNYRTYVKSKSYTQLRGDNPPSSELSYCTYARYNRDFAGFYSGKTLDPNATARPAGLIARSVFNDSIGLLNFTIDSSGIVTSTDRAMYKSINPDIEWTTMDEHFITWMKVAPLPVFRKLYGRINQDLTSGIVNLAIFNHYDVSGWGGEKWVVVGTSGMFGGKNVVLGIVFIVAGVFCFVCCLVFTSAALFVKQKWMDQDPRSWRF